VILDDGRPLVVKADGRRIGRGPWARLFASAIVGDEGSPRAELGRRLASDGSVHTVGVAIRELSGVVGEHAVTITAERMPPRIWAAIARSARGSRPLEAAVAGREQSVHLEHLLTVDWEAPLVPRRDAIVQTCACPVEGACEHVAALAYVLAEEFDRDPSLLLRWRGCTDDAPAAEAAPADPPPRIAAPADAWHGGPLPPARPPRRLPPGAVLKRLGSSGLRVGGNDLADVLERAYACFAASRRAS